MLQNGHFITCVTETQEPSFSELAMLGQTKHGQATLGQAMLRQATLGQAMLQQAMLGQATLRQVMFKFE